MTRARLLGQQERGAKEAERERKKLGLREVVGAGGIVSYAGAVGV